ncbi:MAG TPA: ATP-binding protein [Candidatus Limnocylindria bacterium]|nr:ATP-binding protein [Candidatus Limnocylindria bacterium]
MRTLRTRISLAIALAVLLTVAVVSVASNALIRSRYEAYAAAQLEARMEAVARNLELHFDPATGEWSHDAVYALGMQALYDGFIIRVHDTAGMTVWDAEDHDMARCRQVMDDIARRMREYGADGSFLTRDIALRQGNTEVGSVTVRFYGPFFLSEGDVLFLNALNVLLLAIGAVAVVLSLAVGGVLARRIARPITEAAHVANGIAAGDYSARIEGNTGTRELDDLASAFRHLAETLSRQEALRKQLTADVAHELRTPLATLGSHLEAMLEGVWEPTPERLRGCHEEIIRLGKLVADLERLERAESADLRLNRTTVDLLALIRGVCVNFEAEFANRKLEVSVRGEPAVVQADRDMLAGVVTNLLSNAVKYTPPGGRIAVTVGDSGHYATVAVEDSGSGIPEGELPFIFERFFRADKSRNRGTGGAGIGLAIVKSIVTAHGGTVTAESRHGEGSRFTVTLPKTV